MFLKLCRLELKCSWRSFGFMYLIIFLSSVLLQFQIGSGLLVGLTAMIFSGSIFALIIMIFVNVIRNYYISMFGKQSYLTHTLPVSSTQLLLVKAFGAVFWSVISMIVILLSSALFLVHEDINFFDLFHLAISVLQNTEVIWAMFWLFIRMIITGLSSLFLIYLIMNFTYSCYIKNYRGLIGILIFIVFEMIISYFTWNVSVIFPNYIQNYYFISMAIDLLIGCACFYGAKYLLDHKLELE